MVNNNAGNGDLGLAALIGAGRVRKVICSFPRQSTPGSSTAKYRAGEIELELVPQGNLAERIRAAGAGIGAFYTPTGFGTPLAEGKEPRDHRRAALRARVSHPGRTSLFIAAHSRRPRQPGLPQDSAQLRARHGDGRRDDRRPGLAVVPVGGLDPENVVTP